MSQQRTLTIGEGGIPEPVPSLLNLVGAADQSEASTSVARDARISSVPVEESHGIPPQRNDPQPEEWPNHLRGMPAYRPLDRHLDYSERPMGQNNIEYTFLLFMFTGVRAVGVSYLFAPYLLPSFG